MGGICCCPISDELEDYTYRNGILHHGCLYLNSCLRAILNVHAGAFDRLEEHDLSVSNSEAISSSTVLPVSRSFDRSAVDTYRAPPRPLPYDADIRYARLQRDGLISRRDKSGMSHSHGGEGESIRRAGGDPNVELLLMLPRRLGIESVGQLEENTGEQTKKSFGKVDSVLSLADDEDICPTCLDVYTEENPKINMECEHHFHLACVLEWMERSKLCPMCDKEMVFKDNF